MTMQAVSSTSFGGPEVLRATRVPVPEPLPTEVLVRVTAAGVNPVDWKTRAGGGIAGVLGQPPFVLGWDVTGVVVDVGFGVTRFKPGDVVYGMPWFPRAASAYAEYVTAPSRQLSHAPRSLIAEQAGALPLAGLTAWQALVETAGISAGQRVLIHAAAGGVGHLAVQIAKAAGAYVVGTARTSRHETLRELGVDQPIDYTLSPFESQLKDLDVVLDLVGGDYSLRSLGTLRRGGTLLAIPGGVSEQLAAESQRYGVRATGMLVEPDHQALDQLAALADTGRLRVVIDHVYPLADAAKAHTDGEDGHLVGKSVLIP